MDTRFEVRDLQYLSGLLVDPDPTTGARVVDPQRIGATGASYGGGLSLMLATLKDRIMCGGSETQATAACKNHSDGDLVPWTSPAGTPMHTAAAAPIVPWSDLIYSLVPNGRTLDYTIAQPADAYTPVGIEKQSFVSGLYASGVASGHYAPPSPPRAPPPPPPHHAPPAPSSRGARAPSHGLRLVRPLRSRRRRRPRSERHGQDADLPEDRRGPDRAPVGGALRHAHLGGPAPRHPANRLGPRADRAVHGREPEHLARGGSRGGGEQSLRHHPEPGP